jgi:hypothetical protein
MLGVPEQRLRRPVNSLGFLFGQPVRPLVMQGGGEP